MGKTSFDHEISNLRAAPGELSFDARIGERTTGVWMRTDSPLTPNADAALAAAAMPAMRQGGRLRISDPVSPRMLRGQREFQGVQRAWSLDWPFTEPLQEVEVSAPAREAGTVVPKGRSAAFFSGGVDSWGTVLDNPDLTDLIFVRGFDLAHEGPHAVLADEVEGRLREAAEELGRELHVVTTNLRELSDPHLPWDVYFGCADVAVALFLAPLFDRILIAGDSDYEVQVRFGANLLVDQLWSTEELEIVDDGGRFSRMQRLERLVENPIACRSLRVCWENPDRTYNCGRCRKCLMTLIALEAIGARERVTSFPPELNLDPEVLGEISINHVVSLTLWEDVLDAVRRAGRRDLEEVVARLVAKAKAELGLPRDYRRRHLPGPPPIEAGQHPVFFPAGSEPTLFATPETAAAIRDAEEVAFLVGSYDGSGNFGDILQLDAALELLAPLEPGLLVLPVLERRYASHHPALAEEMIRPPRHSVYFDSGDGGEDGFVPIPAPAELTSAVSYFYGGGYFNGLWGDRKLAMMRAAEGVLAAAKPERLRRFGSGLQVESRWITGLSAEDAALLRAFELLGARDPRSGQILGEFGSMVVAETGDDALGILGRLRPASAPDDGPLRVNLHFAEHDWMTAEPRKLLDFYGDLLVELGQQVGRPVFVQPLIAYLDPRVDERPAVERLDESFSTRGIEVESPAILRPASLGTVTAEMGASSFTISSSYHVALTSLMLGLPTLMLADNPYYEQKAIGLLDSFGQSPGFAIDPNVDPRACAEMVAATVVGAEADRRLRVQLALDVREQRRRRAAAEADLFSRIAGADTLLEEGTSRQAEADAEMDRRVRAAERRSGAAEERAIIAEVHAANLQAQLATLIGSTSWRLTRPLRRLGAKAHRRG